MLSIKKRMEIIGTSIGLFCCYSVFGILQEEIFMKNTPAPFIYPVTFVCILCVFYTFLAKSKL